MRVYFPTRNDNGVRDMSKSVVLGAYLYDGYRGPAEPAAKSAMTPVNLGGMGMNPNQSGPSPAVRNTLAPVISPNPEYIRAPGRFLTPAAPSVSSQSSPTPQVTVPPAPAPTSVYVSSGGGTASPGFSTARSSPQQVAGTPVPIGFPTDSVFINQADGSQWEYSSLQGSWISVGTPYNLAAPSAASLPQQPQVSSAAAASTGSTSAQVYGTPVPIDYPTTSLYVDSSGNTWQFSGATNTWTVSALAATSTAAATTTTTTTSLSVTDQVAAWLSGSTAIGTWSVPNALLAGGVALGVALLMGGSKKR
ncbi:MAG: hypothetical protein WCA19_10350 [Candidatus Acidiferrales bacterium]